MSKLITFKVPTAITRKSRGKLVRDERTYSTRDEQGFIALLKAGDETLRCVLQLDAYGKASILTHFASGYRLVDLAPKALARYVSNPYAWQPTKAGYRELAQEWLDETVKALGQDKFFERLACVPVINV